MDLEFIERFRKKIELSIWLLIGVLFIYVNVSSFSQIIQNRYFLNGILAIVALFTFLYYRVIVKRINHLQTIFNAVLVYTLFVILMIHFSGSLQSPLFSLTLVPILIAAVMLGPKYLIVISATEITWFLIEYYLYFVPNFSSIDQPSTIFWEHITTIVVVAFIALNSAEEINTRQKEHTELIREQKALNEHTEREDAVLESIQEMVLALNARGQILYANPSFEKFVNLKREKYLNRSYFDVLKVYKIDQLGNLLAEADLLFTEQYKLFYDKEDTEEHPQYKLISKSNEMFVEIACTPLHTTENKSGETSGVVVVIRDVNDKRQLELMKLDFVSMAAHELRTPITAIRGYLDALKQDIWNKLTADEQRFLQRADIATIQLATLMENLLSVSRIERGTYSLSIQDLDWLKLINQRVEEFMNRVKERNIELRWTPPSDDFPHVLADQFRIVEVINNLVSNAINYTTEGYIEISVEYSQKDEMVVTHIKDTGQGIPPEALNHMFEKFFRVSGVLEQGSKGTGLGLYISKQIVTLHHGTIWVESELGKGSIFSFSIPTIHNRSVQLIPETKENKT